jgi:hypothetical protein
MVRRQLQPCWRELGAARHTCLQLAIWRADSPYLSSGAGRHSCARATSYARVDENRNVTCLGNFRPRGLISIRGLAPRPNENRLLRAPQFKLIRCFDLPIAASRRPLNCKAESRRLIVSERRACSEAYRISMPLALGKRCDGRLGLRQADPRRVSSDRDCIAESP